MHSCRRVTRTSKLTVSATTNRDLNEYGPSKAPLALLDRALRQSAVPYGFCFSDWHSKRPFDLRYIVNDSARGIALSISVIRCEPARPSLSVLSIWGSLLYAPRSRLRFRCLVRGQQTQVSPLHF